MFFLQTNYTDSNYYMNFAKLRDSRTTFKEDSCSHWDINHGVYIDIFPLDYCPSKNNWMFRIQNMVLKLRILNEFNNKSKAMKTVIAMRIAKVLCPSVILAVKRREQLFKSINSGKYIISHCGAWGKKEIIPSEWYKETVCLEFEGINVKAPKEYNKWLSQVYKNYMTLPPIEKRVAHHYLADFNMKKSFKK